jgi:dynamin-binding protein
MKSPYTHYITHHPVSLTHLNSLPQTAALAAYHAKTRTLAQQLSNAWDLPSLLIKPVQRLLKYALLLNAIIEATPDSHGDKENLRRAKRMLEAVSHAINETQRRREIVKEVFAAGKPAELLKKKGLGIVGRVRGGVTTPRSISRADSEETERVMQMERDMHCTTEFIQKFAKETVDWVKFVHVLMSTLRMWAEGFGRVIGLGPDVTSEAFDAFLVVVDKQLTALCIDLKALVEEQLLPQLRVLLDTIKRPGLLLETLHALEPHHYVLLQHNPAKGRPPPALNEASVAFVALRAQLITELPAYLSLLDAGVTLCVSQVIKWQARLWRDVRTRWSDLWDALRVEGEMNAGNEETERVWRARWEEATRDLYNLNIIHPDKLTPRSRQARMSPPSPTTTRTGTVNASTSSLEPARSPQIDTASFVESSASPHRKRSFNTNPSVHRLARRPSTESLQSIRSARSSSGHGHYVDAPEFSPSPPRHPMPRRQSMPMSLHHSQSHGRLLDSYGREGRDRDREGEEEQGARGGGVKHTSPLPSLQRRNLGAKRVRPAEPHRQPSPHPPHRQYSHPHPHPPMPPMPQLTVSSRWYRAPALYTCRVVHECEPPEGVEYYGLPFFKLFLDDVYQVLKEAGHPSRHRDLPLLVDEGEDCLLLARDSSGSLGWLLASFLFPAD